MHKATRNQHKRAQVGNTKLDPVPTTAHFSKRAFWPMQRSVLSLRGASRTRCFQLALLCTLFISVVQGGEQDKPSEGDGLALFIKGIEAYYMGDVSEAIQVWREAQEVYKEIKGAELGQKLCWGFIGKACFQSGQYTQSVAAYQKAGSEWWVYHGLGLAYRFRAAPGDAERAMHTLWAALETTETVRASVIASSHRASIFEEPARVFPDFVSVLMDAATKEMLVTESGVMGWAQSPKDPTALQQAAFHFADRGKGRALEDSLRERTKLKLAHPGTKLLTEDKELTLRLSKLASLREQIPATEVERKKKLTEDIEELQQRRNMIEAELKRTASGGYVAPEFRKPMEMAKELDPGTAVLQYSIGEAESWLLILTRDGVTAQKLGAATSALPELLPHQEATLDRLVEAWKTRTDKVGLAGLVRLARARTEDFAKPKHERHNLIDAEQEKAVLGRLAAVILPDSALYELRMKAIRNLLVIPDASLHYIPFATLRLTNENHIDTHYLVEEFASSYVPAMTTLGTIRKQKQEREKKRPMERRLLLAFAAPSFGSESLQAEDDMVTRGDSVEDPRSAHTEAVHANDKLVAPLRRLQSDYYKGGGLKLVSLPETEQEALRAASLFAPPRQYEQSLTDDPEGKVVIFTGKGASEQEVKRLLSGGGKPAWRDVIFSTHALADTRNGMLSCLALSSPTADSQEDGFLQAQEVMNLELDSDLVMLSACQTGLGRLRGGEGVIGLSGAFFYAGAESVCASLWQVPSGPTTQLTTEFFRHLKDGKLDRAEALRQAQLTVLRQGRSLDGKPVDYSSPFCWAAFVLMGEYK
jgi:CHAT domain-containing protein